MSKMKPTVIDMFSGCGGLSKGFMDAGYEILIGIDHDEVALKTFKYNHGDAIAFQGDLFKKDTILDIANLINNKKIDVIIGGPPCQGFSLTGTRREEDARNTLFQSMVEAVKLFKPQTFILENVPGLATLYGGKAKKAILEEFGNLGYTINSQILYAPDYGIPQIRRRVFFVGMKNGKLFEFPKPILNSNNYITCEQAIGDLPSLENDLGVERAIYTNSPQSDYQELMRKNSKFILNHIGTVHTELVKSVIALVPEGGNHKDLPPGVGDSRKFNEAWTRYHSQKPSKTIDTGHRNHFHYKWNRVPTVRENARLQSFPDNFEFFGNKTQQYRQVGNAVPPLLGYHLALELKKYLD